MIYLGADHNGFRLKQRIRDYLSAKSLSYIDYGAFSYKKTDDYPDFARAVGKNMKAGDLGILFCGSGHGMVIAANKMKGIRAIMPPTPKSARDGRHDDHANVCVIAGWECNFVMAARIITSFLSTKPDKKARYLRRLRKISVLER